VLTDYVYWHAPVWELLLAGLTSAIVLGWLAFRALRRPNSETALAGVDPALGSQPLFFFDAVRGVTPLNAGARRLLALASVTGAGAESGTPEDRAVDRTLVEVLLQAYETTRTVQRTGWPEPGHTLIAIPLAHPSEAARGVIATGAAATGVIATEVTATGVIAIVATDGLASPVRPQAGAVAEPTTAALWLALGPTLRVHQTRPLTEVRRVDDDDPGSGWSTHQLAHTEETLLRRLVGCAGQVQPGETLFRLIWPGETVSRNGLHADQKDRLRRLVFQLRQHTEPDPAHPRYVCTAHGVGYVLYRDAEVGDP
jgi:hypothetical protein